MDAAGLSQPLTAWSEPAERRIPGRIINFYERPDYVISSDTLHAFRNNRRTRNCESSGTRRKAMDLVQEPGSAPSKSEIRSCFDPAEGTLDRRVFADREIYDLEMRNIFARAWNFMCHESQIPNPGDYFINYIGEDQVIVVRDRQGEVQVLLNTCCRHRGSLRSAAPGAGQCQVLCLCSYHGWNYDLNGDLIGVPGMTAYYRKDFDKSQWGLAQAAAGVIISHGFYFATLDPDTPPLPDYLGEVGRIGLGLLVANGPVEVVDGVQKERHRLQPEDCRRRSLRPVPQCAVRLRLGLAIQGILDIAAILHPEQPDGDVWRVWARNQRSGHSRGAAGGNRRHER